VDGIDSSGYVTPIIVSTPQSRPEDDSTDHHTILFATAAAS